MSEPIRKPSYAPESYDPKAPEIVGMVEQAQQQTEKLIETFTVGKAVFEIFDRPEVLWVGTLAWAENNHDEPDIDALLKKFQAMCEVPKLERMNPDWSAGISINYSLNGKAPRGTMFGQETWSNQQDSRYDMFTQPAGLYLRVRQDKYAKKLLGKKHFDSGELYAAMADAAARHGYRRAAGNPIEIYYHDHANGTAEYAYVSVEKTPESYDPKTPEIVNMVEQAQQPKQGPLQGRLSAITLVDLPKAKVASYEVTSKNPEQESGEFIAAWIREKLGLRVGESGTRSFGFDCHKNRKIPKGQRIYHQYVLLPKGFEVAGDKKVTIKDFPGGTFARIAVRDPFIDSDFPLAWGVLLEWAAENHIPNRLGCKKDDIYSLFSCEESPCFEEVYKEDGVQYMAMYLPVNRHCNST